MYTPQDSEQAGLVAQGRAQISNSVLSAVRRLLAGLGRMVARGLATPQIMP